MGDNLQKLLERAAEIDRAKTIHLELTRQGSLARSKMLFEMMGGNAEDYDDDDEVETKSPATSNNSKKKMRRHSTGSSVQGNSTSAVHIEMGTISSSSTNGSGEEKEIEMLESKDDSSSIDGAADLSSSSLGETPFK